MSTRLHNATSGPYRACIEPRPDSQSACRSVGRSLLAGDDVTVLVARPRRWRRLAWRGAAASEYVRTATTRVGSGLITERSGSNGAFTARTGDAVGHRDGSGLVDSLRRTGGGSEELGGVSPAVRGAVIRRCVGPTAAGGHCPSHRNATNAESVSVFARSRFCASATRSANEGSSDGRST